MPCSIEVGQDAAALAQEMQRLIGEAFDDSVRSEVVSDVISCIVSIERVAVPVPSARSRMP